MPLVGMGRDPTVKSEWGAILDVTNLLAQGLTNWFVLNEAGGNPRDVTTGAGGMLTSGIGWSASEAGPCLVKNVDSSATTDYFDTGLRVNSSSGTVVFRVYLTAAYNSATVDMLWGATKTDYTAELSCQKYSDGNLYFGWTNGGVDYRVALAASAGNWTQNQWQTYALAWSSSGSVLYRNGLQIGSTATAPVVAAIPANIALLNSGGVGSPLTSGTKISDWMVYNRVLSAGEVASLYAQPYGLFLPSNTRRFYGTAQAWQRTLAELLALSDARGAFVGKAVSEALGLIDGRSAAAYKSLNDVVSWADALTATLTAGGQAFSKLLMEALSWTDARQMGARKSVAEALNLTDSRVLGLARRLGEALGFTDDAQATGAGLAMLTLVTSGAFGDWITKSGHGDGVREIGGKA